MRNNYNKLTHYEKNVLKRNVILKDIHLGKRAFVIVNGPSLKKQDLSYLKDEITFSVSGFWKHPVVKIWQPKYHCVIDSTFFQDKPNIHEFWTEVRSNIPNSKLIVPLDEGYVFCKKFKSFQESNTFFVALTGAPNYSIDMTKLVQGFQSVSAFALANAIYMGCNPIYLLGFDHDYLAHRGIDHHFYEGSCIVGHKNEVVPISDQNSYMEEMRSMTSLFENYYNLKEVAKQKSIEIFNATDGGYLDIFPRIHYDDIAK